MENLNKLSFLTYKINENSINIPMEDIKQEFDTNKYAKQYLFKIVYISKHLKDRNYIVYLSPLENNSGNIPIVRATIPLEIIRSSKIVPSYDYERDLTTQEKYFIDERNYREITKINRMCRRRTRLGEYYVLVYGYFVNKYKNDNALTEITEGIQDFHISTDCIRRITIQNHQTLCYITNRWDLICKALGKTFPRPVFKETPDDFFVKERR